MLLPFYTKSPRLFFVQVSEGVVARASTGVLADSHVSDDKVPGNTNSLLISSPKDHFRNLLVVVNDLNNQSSSRRFYLYFSSFVKLNVSARGPAPLRGH